MITLRVNVENVFCQSQFSFCIAITHQINFCYCSSMLPREKILRILSNHIFYPTKLFMWVVLDVSQNSSSIDPNIVVVQVDTKSVRSQAQGSLWILISFADCSEVVEDFNVWRVLKSFTNWFDIFMNLHSSEYRMLTTGTDSSCASSFTSLHSLLYRYILFKQRLISEWIYFFSLFKRVV